MSVVLRASVVKRERQTNLRLACVALERIVADDADALDSTTEAVPRVDARASASRAANEALLARLDARGGELTIVGFWESKGMCDPLAALHFLSRDSGGAPSFRCAPSDACDDEERESIESLHGEMLGENKTAVVQMKGEDGTRELHLVAVPRGASEDEGEGPSTAAVKVATTMDVTRFIAFETKEMAPAYAMPLLKHNRLVVVLDLDETLVQATTLHALDRRIEKTRGRMVSLMKFDHNNPRASAVMVEEVKKERMACEVALRRLQTDRAMLAQYCVEGAVTLNNRRSVTIPEIESLPNGTQRLKNVIRMPSPHIKGGMIVFTVINPADPGTAMLVHVRPGWEELRKYLSGQDRQSKRAEVFVCTMANIEYAREMCRILDQHGTVFDPAQLEHRVKSVAPNELKSLARTCGAHFPTELAVIVDDRTAVWEPGARPHILAVTPFMPYGNDVEYGTTIEQHEARGTGGVLGAAQNMMETLRLRWHMDYEKFAHKARKHIQDTAAHGALRPPPPATKTDEDAAPTTSARDDHAAEGDHAAAARGPADALRADHARKKAIHLFYPPNAADLLTPLMEAGAKEAALSIAERGGAARAAAGAGSRLAAALGTLDRNNKTKIGMQMAKKRADADAEGDTDSKNATNDAEVKSEHVEKESKPRFRHIDMAEISVKTPATKTTTKTTRTTRTEPTSPAKKVSPKSQEKTLSGKKRSRGEASDSESYSEPISESEPEPEDEEEDEEDEDEDEDEDEHEHEHEHEEDVDEEMVNGDEDEYDQEEELKATSPKRGPKPKKAPAKRAAKVRSKSPTKKASVMRQALSSKRTSSKAKSVPAKKSPAKPAKPAKVFRKGTRESTRLSQSQ